MSDIKMLFDESYNFDITRTIDRIVKTGTDGLVDTYTIYYTDGGTDTYTVTNGAQGPQGETGPKGGDTGETGPQGVKGDTGETGPQGRRGSEIIAVRTAPHTGSGEGYTYWAEVSSILQESGVDALYVGDIIEFGWYHYPLVILNETYAYFSHRYSVRGPQGEAGPQGPQGDDYTLTAQDKQDIADIVIADLPTWTGGAY